MLQEDDDIASELDTVRGFSREQLGALGELLARIADNTENTRALTQLLTSYGATPHFVKTFTRYLVRPAAATSLPGGRLLEYNVAMHMVCSAR